LKATRSRYPIIHFLPFLYPFLLLEILVLVLLIIESAGSLATPYALKVIIDDIFPKGNYRDLIKLLTVLMIIYVIRISCNIIIEVVSTIVSQRIASKIREHMLTNMLDLSIDYYRTSQTGELVNIIINDIQNIQSSISTLILAFLDNMLTVIGIVIMLFFLNLSLTIVTLSIVPVILISIKYFTPRIQVAFKRSQEIQGFLNDYFIEKIRNIRVIKNYKSINYELKKFWQLQNRSIKFQIDNSYLNSINSNLVVFLVALGPIVVLIFGGKGVFHGVMTIGSLIAFIQYFNRLVNPTISIMNSYTQFTKAMVSMERVLPFIREKPSRENTSIDNTEVIYLQFESVCYFASGRWILDNVNLSFQAGKLYCLVGASGSGKSTIINMLCGFLRPTSGDVFAVGSTMKTVEISKLNIGLIEKEYQLFRGTIKENITYGMDQVSFSQVQSAVQITELSAVIHALPDGIETIINETGGTLSDGQKQRISIARAVLRKPQVFIFDESTSSLDLQLEALIILRIKAAFPKAIIIIVTHRLNILQKADYIFSLKDGKIEQTA